MARINPPRVITVADVYSRAVRVDIGATSLASELTSGAARPGLDGPGHPVLVTGPFGPAPMHRRSRFENLRVLPAHFSRVLQGDAGPASATRLLGYSAG